MSLFAESEMTSFTEPCCTVKSNLKCNLQHLQGTSLSKCSDFSNHGHALIWGFLKSWQHSVSLCLFSSYFALVPFIAFFLIIFIKISLQFNRSVFMLDAYSGHLNVYFLCNAFAITSALPVMSAYHPPHTRYPSEQVWPACLCATSAYVNLCVVVCL